MPIPNPEPCTECPHVLTTNRCPTCDAAVCGICDLHHKHSHTAPKRPTVRTFHGETGKDACTPSDADFWAAFAAAGASVGEHYIPAIMGLGSCPAPTPEAP